MNRWPLVGRDEVAAQLRQLIAAGTGAVVTGPPGVGKTALVAACIQDLAGPETRVVFARATRAARSLPFGAFAAMLPPDDPWPRDAVMSDTAVLRRVARAFVDSAGAGQLLVVVDDAHLLDDASAALVHHLSTSGSAAVVATALSGHPAPDAITSLWADGSLERLDLDALAADDLDVLLANVFDAPLDHVAAQQLAALSAGNPLFLRELVLGAMANGDLVREDGRWQLHGTLRPSRRLSELIELRLDRLDERERELIQLVALREPLGAAELHALSDDTVAESLARESIISIRVDGRRAQVWLTHPLYGEVARASVSALRMRELLRRLAGVVEDLGRRRREDVLVVATWRLFAGGGDPEVLLAGAQAARARNDPELAGRLASAAVDAGGGFDAHFAVAEAAYLRGDHDTVGARIPTLHDLVVTDHQRTQLAQLECDVSSFVRGKPDPAILETAAKEVTDPDCLDQLAAAQLSVLWLTQGVGSVVAAAEKQLASIGRRSVRYSWAGPYAMATAGRIAEALELLDRPAEPSGNPSLDAWLEGLRVRYRSTALMHAGRLAEADALLTPAYEQASAEGNDELRGLHTVGLANIRLAQGRIRSGRAHAEEGARLFRNLGQRLRMREPLTISTTAAALEGDVAAASAALDELHSLGIAAYGDDSDLLRTEAWTAMALGDTPRAITLLLEAAEVAEATGNLTSASAVWQNLARIGDARMAEARLERLADRVEGDFMPARLAYVRGLARRDPDLLEEAAHACERIGALLFAAEAFNEAAVLRRRAGDPRAAAANARQAEALRARCEGAVTPLLGDIDVRAALTPAEMATARLAATGGSNRVIASTMHVSVRTVENRLQHVYDKLGVRSRHDLAAMLDRVS